MLAQHANTLCDVVVRCLHTLRSATVPGELPPDAARQTWSLDRRKQLACFHLSLIFLTLIFVGFRPSKIHMALSLKTRNFNFGDPTTPRTPNSPDLINCDSARQISACILRSMRRMEALDTRH